MKHFCVCLFGVMIVLFNFVVLVNFHLVLHVTYVFSNVLCIFSIKAFCCKNSSN